MLGSVTATAGTPASVSLAQLAFTCVRRIQARLPRTEMSQWTRTRDTHLFQITHPFVASQASQESAHLSLQRSLNLQTGVSFDAPIPGCVIVSLQQRSILRPALCTVFAGLRPWVFAFPKGASTLHPVRFELTQLSLWESSLSKLETHPLDHSGTGAIRDLLGKPRMHAEPHRQT